VPTVTTQFERASSVGRVDLELLRVPALALLSPPRRLAGLGQGSRYSAPMSGTVSHIHIGSQHGAEPRSLEQVRALANKGLEGDRNLGSIRNVTIVCEGELAKAAADMGEDTLVPGSTRRNITVTLDELPRTHGTRIELGEVVVEVWRNSSPCELMETSVGPGARDALKGRAGISATVTHGGVIRVGDPVIIDAD